MPRRKALKVVVGVELHAVTCPGVFLAGREDVFITLKVFGEMKCSKFHPPVFPFLFHEKIRFEKVFPAAADPVQVAQELYNENVSIELVQMGYPDGELLGSYTDNARDFLFPTPKVSPSYPGMDREILFQRSTTFPGIAPKLEFSSKTTIKEVTLGRFLGEKKYKEQRDSREPCHLSYDTNNIETVTSSETSCAVRPSKSKFVGKRKKKSTSTGDVRRGRSTQRAKSASQATTIFGYEQPTIASMARSPSPYARRKMAELAIKDPFESATKAKPFKTEIDQRPDFVVRKCTPPPPRSPTSERKSSRHRPSSSQRSYASPRFNGVNSPANACNIALSNSSDDCSDLHTSLHCLRDTPIRSRISSSCSALAVSPGLREPSISVGDLDMGSHRQHPADSILHRPPLEDRLSTQPSPYEKIRDRVRALLSSRATRIVDDVIFNMDRYQKRISRSPSPCSPSY